MPCRVWSSVAAAVVLSALAGCSTREPVVERSSWRVEAENACIAQNLAPVSQWIQPAAAIEGPDICGLAHPFTVTALAGGSVAFQSPQTLGCPMIAALDTWIVQVLQPAAQAAYGQPVVAVRIGDSYSCRHAQMNPLARYSEHAFGNAIDMSVFRFADGREISVLRDWNGDATARRFLRAAHGGACGIFTTTLGPGYPKHDNHFHLDLGQHGNTSRGPRRYCRPQSLDPGPLPPKRDNLPDPPPLQEELDVASRSGGAAPSSMVSYAPVPQPTATPVPGAPTDVAAASGGGGTSVPAAPGVPPEGGAAPNQPAGPLPAASGAPSDIGVASGAAAPPVPEDTTTATVGERR